MLPDADPEIPRNNLEMTLDISHALIAFIAAFMAGLINSVAGGGTLISFPTLIWLGLSSVNSNATNTVALWPGSLGGAWGYRRDLRRVESRLLAFIIPSVLGGMAGALLLAQTPPDVFDRLVPALVLFATFLFMFRGLLQSRFNPASGHAELSAPWPVAAPLIQFGVALYGGYFGAGIGILMLAALSLLGMNDIHQMNGLKNLLALCINASASLYFAWAQMVYWPYAVIMAVGAVAGGYSCAGIAYRLGARAVQRIVVVIGFVMAFSLFLRH